MNIYWAISLAAALFFSVVFSSQGVCDDKAQAIALLHQWTKATKGAPSLIAINKRSSSTEGEAPTYYFFSSRSSKYGTITKFGQLLDWDDKKVEEWVNQPEVLPVKREYLAASNPKYLFSLAHDGQSYLFDKWTLDRGLQSEVIDDFRATLRPRLEEEIRFEGTKNVRVQRLEEQGKELYLFHYDVEVEVPHEEIQTTSITHTLDAKSGNLRRSESRTEDKAGVVTQEVVVSWKDDNSGPGGLPDIVKRTVKLPNGLQLFSEYRIAAPTPPASLPTQELYMSHYGFEEPKLDSPTVVRGELVLLAVGVVGFVLALLLSKINRSRVRV